MRDSKRNYFHNLAYSNTKDFWKTIKTLNKNKSTIPALQLGNCTAESDSEKAQMLNTFFASCWNTSEEPIKEEAYQCYDSPTHDDFRVTPEEVFSLINKLDTNKASGPDCISAHMLKATASSIALPLTTLFNLSLSTGKFPDMWKLAGVVPIPKSKDKNDPCNYRPISLLSIVSKLLEKIVYTILWEHLLEYYPLSLSQWGFQKGKSATNALLSTTSDWHLFLDKRIDVLCVFFDFKKAFDTVPHGKLMEKVSRIGFAPKILSWLCSYLSGRKQYVMVNGEQSQATLVRSGVPQGSVLGPLLFLIYINDITELHFSEQSRLSLYADDILLYKPIISECSFSEIQQDIDHLFVWSQENMLFFNVAKCKCLFLTNKPNISFPRIQLDNQPIEFVQSYKYLGVTITSNLSWSQHIQVICKKARSVLGIIYHKISKNTNDPLTLLRLYTALVRPHLEHAAQVWNPYLEKDIQCIENVQKFALRICAKDYTVSYVHLLDVFLLPSLKNRRLYLSLCSFYSIVNGLAHFPKCTAILTTHPMCSSRSHSPHMYMIPFARCNAFKYSFFCTVIRLWNCLPHEAHSCSNLLEFKRYISPYF